MSIMQRQRVSNNLFITIIKVTQSFDLLAAEYIFQYQDT